MKKYVTHLKAKPEHVRKRVAIGATAGVTALIAIVWITTLAHSGAFALAQDPSVIDKANSQPQLATGGVKSSVEQLLGAVGAAGATSSAPALTIIDNQSASTFAQPAPTSNNATVLSF